MAQSYHKHTQFNAKQTSHCKTNKQDWINTNLFGHVKTFVIPVENFIIENGEIQK